MKEIDKARVLLLIKDTLWYSLEDKIKDGQVNDVWDEIKCLMED